VNTDEEKRSSRLTNGLKLGEGSFLRGSEDPDYRKRKGA